MDVQAALIIAEGRIARLVPLHPIAYLIPEFQMLARAPVELVRKGPEEAVSVAEGGSGVEAEGAELVGEEGGVLEGVGGELLVSRVSVLSQRDWVEGCIGEIGYGYEMKRTYR